MNTETAELIAALEEILTAPRDREIPAPPVFYEMVADQIAKLKVEQAEARILAALFTEEKK